MSKMMYRERKYRMSGSVFQALSCSVFILKFGMVGLPDGRVVELNVPTGPN